jgi:hypothetical protein
LDRKRNAPDRLSERRRAGAPQKRTETAMKHKINRKQQRLSTLLDALVRIQILVARANLQAIWETAERAIESAGTATGRGGSKRC